MVLLHDGVVTLPPWITRLDDAFMFHHNVGGMKSRILNGHYREGEVYKVVGNEVFSVLKLPEGTPQADKKMLLRVFRNQPTKGWQE
jgi:hypothetical protein